MHTNTTNINKCSQNGMNTLIWCARHFLVTGDFTGTWREPRQQQDIPSRGGWQENRCVQDGRQSSLATHLQHYSFKICSRHLSVLYVILCSCVSRRMDHAILYQRCIHCGHYALVSQHLRMGFQESLWTVFTETWRGICWGDIGDEVTCGCNRDGLWGDVQHTTPHSSL